MCPMRRSRTPPPSEARGAADFKGLAVIFDTYDNDGQRDNPVVTVLQVRAVGGGALQMSRTIGPGSNLLSSVFFCSCVFLHRQFYYISYKILRFPAFRTIINDTHTKVN